MRGVYHFNPPLLPRIQVCSRIYHCFKLFQTAASLKNSPTEFTAAGVKLSELCQVLCLYSFSLRILFQACITEELTAAEAKLLGNF